MSNTLFSIGTAQHGGRSFACLHRQGMIVEIARIPGFAAVDTTLSLFAEWLAHRAALTRALETPEQLPWLALADVVVDAPVAARQIFCTGANYRKHVAELTAKQPDPTTVDLTSEQRIERVLAMMDERARVGTPYAFVKLPTAISGPFGRIILPRGAQEVDWELELAVVIGQTARHVTRDNALSHVAGYMIANDITARDRVYRHDMKAIGTDWLAAKCAATFLPCGPWIVPAQFVADPQDLNITLRLNGQVMQNESTSDMIYDVARQIEYVSSLVTLMPGDIICTGSPAGNGTHYQRFLQPGDIVTGTITGLGEQRLECVAEADAE